MGPVLTKLVNPRWAVFLLLVVTTLAYIGAVGAGFVWDDFPLVVDNPKAQSFDQWRLWFTEDLWSLGADSVQSGFYRPLVLGKFCRRPCPLGRKSSGVSPAVAHVASRLCFPPLSRSQHGCGARVRLGGCRYFALHPALTEAVVWVAARNDLMATAFLLGMLLALSEERVSRARLAVGCLCFFFALLSKESSVLGIGVLLAVDWARVPRPRGLSRYGGLGVVLLIWMALRSSAGVGAADLDLDAGVSLLAENGDQVLGLYARLLFWPFDLSVGRSLEYLSEPPLLTFVGLVGAGGLLGLAAARGGRLGLAGLLIAALGSAPALVAVAAKAQIGERYLYLPFLGLALVVAAVHQKTRLKGVGAGVLVLLGVGFWGIQKRVPDWTNEVSLWRAAVDTDPSPYTWGNLGHMHNRQAEALAEQGELEAGRHRELAMDWLERSFAHPLPYYDNCGALLRLPFRARAFERGLRHLEIGETAGCQAHPTQGGEFEGLRGVLLAVNGQWDAAQMALPGALRAQRTW